MSACTLSQPRCCASSDRHFHTMDILASLRQAPSAELYRLYLAIGTMLDDHRRILEVRQRLHLRMAVNYIDDNPLGPPSTGIVVDLRQTQAVIQDNVARRRWPVLNAAITPEPASHPLHVEPAPPPRRSVSSLRWRHSRVHPQASERTHRRHLSRQCVYQHRTIHKDAMQTHRGGASCYRRPRAPRLSFIELFCYVSRETLFGPDRLWRQPLRCFRSDKLTAPNAASTMRVLLSLTLSA